MMQENVVELLCCIMWIVFELMSQYLGPGLSLHSHYGLNAEQATKS